VLDGYSQVSGNPHEQASQSTVERWVVASDGGAPVDSQGCGVVGGSASAGHGRSSA
jgi:hypothetical protein